MPRLDPPAPRLPIGINRLTGPAGRDAGDRSTSTWGSLSAHVFAATGSPPFARSYAASGPCCSPLHRSGRPIWYTPRPGVRPPMYRLRRTATSGLVLDQPAASGPARHRPRAIRPGPARPPRPCEAL